MATQSQQAKPVVSPKVAALAVQRNLGELLDRRGNGNPFIRAMVLIATATGAFGLFYLMTLPSWRILGFLALIPLVYGIVTPIWAVIVLVRGYQQTFLYQGGLVFVKNGSPRAATWSDVTGLEVLMFGESSIFNGKTSAYLVKLSNGAPMRVGSSEIALPDGQRDPFGGRLIQVIQATGRPIVPRVVHGKKA
jgi:hypothetical protein